MLNGDSLAFVDALTAGNMVDAPGSSAQFHKLQTQVAGATTTIATISSPPFVRHLRQVAKRVEVHSQWHPQHPSIGHLADRSRGIEPNRNADPTGKRSDYFVRRLRGLRLGVIRNDLTPDCE